jgi:hypothetical protein
MKHLNRLIFAVTIAGTVALTAIPASAWSNSFTLWHCKQWHTQMGVHGQGSTQAMHQVQLLSTNPLSKPNVKTRATAFYAAPGSTFALQALDNACWTVPGMGP